MSENLQKPAPRLSGKSNWIRTVVVFFLVLLTTAVAFFSIARWMARTAPYDGHPTCQRNLGTLGIIGKMYANEHDDYFPELSMQPGTLAMRDDAGYRKVYPEYLTDLSVLRCPPPKQRFNWFSSPPPPAPAPTTVSDDQDYFYLGYQISDQGTLEKFAEAYRARIASGEPFHEDLRVDGLDGTEGVIPRLRDVDTSMHDDTRYEEHKLFQARFPVFIERFPNRHALHGGFVLYMDGHSEFVKMGEKWPMTPEAMEVLLALDGLGSATWKSQ